MKRVTVLFILVLIALPSYSTKELPEKPVQHIKLAEITTLNEAEKVFLKKTAELKEIKEFNQSNLEKIHVITYSLEKSMAYYVKNLNGEHKATAEYLADRIELIHIHSENNRPKETQEFLKQYFRMAQYLPLAE